MATFTFLAPASLTPKGVVAAFHPRAEDVRPPYPQGDPPFDPTSFLSSLLSPLPLPTPPSLPSRPPFEPPMLVPTAGGDQEGDDLSSPSSSSSFLLEEEDMMHFDLTFAYDPLRNDLFAPLAEKQQLEAKPEPLFLGLAAHDADTSRFLDDCLTEELRDLPSEPSPSPSPSAVSLAPSPIMSAFPSRAGSPFFPSSPPALSSPPAYYEGGFPSQPSRKRPRAGRGLEEVTIPVLPPRKRKVGEVMPEGEKKERNKVAAQKYRQRLRVCAEEAEVTCKRLQLENTELACQIRMERENIERLKQTLVKCGVIPASALSCN